MVDLDFLVIIHLGTRRIALGKRITSGVDDRIFEFAFLWILRKPKRLAELSIEGDRINSLEVSRSNE